MVSLHDIYSQMQQMSDRQALFLGKLDTLALTWNAQVEALNRDIAVVRADALNFRADYVKARDDHEHRIRAIEVRPTVTPRAMWSAMTALIAAVGVATAIISLVTR
jgi:hypothetical protein